MKFLFMFTPQPHVSAGERVIFQSARASKYLFYVKHLIPLLPLHPPSHLSQISATMPPHSQMGALLPAESPRPHTASEARARAHIVQHMHCRGVVVLRGVLVHVEQGP